MATRAEWTKRVKQWKRSGLDGAEFAKREGLKVKQLYWWAWKLGASAAERQAPEPEPRFLPVRVVESPPPVAAPTSPPEPAWPAPTWIDITLPNGSLVRVLPGVDPATLACVLAVVAELSC